MSKSKEGHTVTALLFTTAFLLKNFTIYKTQVREHTTQPRVLHIGGQELAQPQLCASVPVPTTRLPVNSSAVRNRNSSSNPVLSPPP